MNINPNQTKIKRVYKPGTPTRPLIIVRGYPQPVNQKAIQEYLESFGRLDQIVFHSSHVTIQYATDNIHETLRRSKLRFENKSLSIKIVNKHNNQQKAKRIKVPKKKQVQLKDENVKPKDKALHSKNKNENIPVKNLKKSLNNIDPLQLVNEITKFKTADDQLMHLMKEIQLPYQEVETNHLGLCQYLESALSNDIFVIRGCRAMPFGSTITGLAFKWAELDVFIQNLNIPNNLTNDPGAIAQYINQSKTALQRTGLFYGIQVGREKINTQYLRCTHESTEIICNIYFKNALGVCNSNLVYFLLNSDVRLRPMMMVIKYWAKINDITGPGKISNYTLVMLLIFHLQQNPKPILPNISMLQDPSFEKIIAGWNAGYNDEFNFHTLNDYSIPYLLHGFFEFYGTYDFSTKVVSPFTGTSISKTMFYNANELEDILWLYKKNFFNNQFKKLDVDSCMCVQDPFEHNHNLTKSVNMTTIKVFQQCCTSAALICRKAIDSQSIISLLPKLLKVHSCKYEITILPTSSLDQNIDLMDIVARPRVEEEYQKFWFGRVNDILLIILKKVIKFDIKLTKLDQSTDIQDDIIEAFNISCIGYFEIHHSRSRVSRKIGTSVGLKREIAISDYIVENFNKSRVLNKKPILEMDILFSARRNPTRIVLELRNRQEELKSCFVIYEQYLQKWLPIWMDKYLQEKAEDILAASTSSECK